MSLIPRLPLFAATLTLLSLALALVFLTGYPAPAAQAQTDSSTSTTTTTATVDYDSNDDRLIEISNLAQLNAVRWDLNGDGAVDATSNNASYTAAFPNAAAGMGCPDGSDADANPDPCLGYELKSDLTFDSNGDGSVTVADSGGLYWNSGAGWTPIGDARRNPYTGQFQGRGKVISHLFISNSARQYVGLFGAIGRGGSATGVGLTQVSIASSRPAVAGGLAGSNSGAITSSYASGTLTVNVSGGGNANSLVGGLVGHNSLTGTTQASYANVAVSATHSRAAAIAGGLAGQNDGNIRASYAAGAVSAAGSNRFTKAGGLAGNNGGTITASYARGRVTATGSGAGSGGLVGGALRNGSVTASYWDTTTSGQTASAGGTGQTTSALQSPMGYNYSGIYAGWNLNLDGVTGGDSPWHFGGANQYPALIYGVARDYDTDNDRLIEVNNLAQLNAIRWDLDTNGAVATADQANYTAAFPAAIAGMGCAQGTVAAACNGYELMVDLDFDTDGDGDVDAADSGGRYWNGGQGWTPIGNGPHATPVANESEWLARTFNGTFQGNGKTISNLYIHHTQTTLGGTYGLFEQVGTAGVIDGVNLRDANIHIYSGDRIYSGDWIGTLVGGNSGAIRGSSATGRINAVSDNGALAGGLVAENSGSITNSYAKTEITGAAEYVGGLTGRNALGGWGGKTTGVITASYSSEAAVTTSSSIPRSARVGGLVGQNWGTITDSYSRSPVKTTGDNASVGGLVGDNFGWRDDVSKTTFPGSITASYATGPVTATGDSFWVGGLVGHNGGTIAASYSRNPVKATGNGAVVGYLAGKDAAVGGLVGDNARTITASYSRSSVKATGNNARAGGLVGINRSATFPGTITASYAMGPVVATGTSPTVGGLVGRNGYLDESGKVVSQGTAVDSYWDTEVSGQSSSALGTGIGGTGMRSYGTGSYSGNYANWNLNLDGVAGNDDPWAFPDGQYPALKYGGLDVVDQIQFYIWDEPEVGRTARTNWHVSSWLTRARGHGGFIWERSPDGIDWTVVVNKKTGVGRIRNGNAHFHLFIEPYEANHWFRVRRMSNERGWVYGYVSRQTGDWTGPTATLTFASGHTAPRVGQAIAISGTNAVKWIRCNDTAGNGCDVIVRAATGYTPVAADQGKYLYAYRYYDNAQSVKTLGKTGYIGPVAATATP